MKTLEEEANKKWLENLKTGLDSVAYKFGFIAGANSKWVQSEKIKAQIEILDKLRHEIRDYDYVKSVIDEIGDTIKQLEDESQRRDL